ncbi:MAG: NADH-ubiquinone oxidoreductase-F iron-sulfur binding region domain-containing protein [Gemmataceae bacterium]
MNQVELAERAQKERDKQKQIGCRVLCCAGTGCLSNGGKGTQEGLKEALATRNIEEKVQIIGTGCMGLCSEGPLVRVAQPDRPEVLFSEISKETAEPLVDKYLAPALENPTSPDPKSVLPDHLLPLESPFFSRQKRVVLRNAGLIDPISVDEYLAADGYKAAAQVLLEKTPEEVIEEIIQSGLRGRGGAGFPTGLKWKFTRAAQGEEKFIICNGDEGDPGAYMDRSVLEGDPHSIIEGMIIGGYAMGANQGYFYIRAEYQLAVERVEQAIRQARKAKLLGKDIFGSGFNFSVEVRLGAGAFVCGEETALIASIEGKRGTPLPRPPYPSVKGLWDAPTCINNVETLATIPRIMLHGADWYASMGTEKSRGTKVFAITGSVANSGLVEIPMGTTLRELVMDIGGGTASGKPVKAVQTGGPSGGVIPANLLDTPVSFEHLMELGSIMGSGGLIVMEDGDSMVDIARFYLGFCVDESCGKCAPCRIGGKHMLLLLEKLADGKGSHEDIKQLRRISQAMKVASLCGLGQTAPNPVLSTLQYFENEYQEAVTPA